MNSVTVPVETFSGRDEAPIVLVDFARFSNEVTLSNLMREEATRRGLYLMDAVAAFTAAGDSPTIDEVAEASYATLTELKVRPAGIFGYCSAAKLSLRLAEQFARRDGVRPELVLVDPSWPDPSLIAADLADALRSLDAAGPPPAADATVTDLASVLDPLRAELGRKLAADGTPEEEIELCVDLLLDRYQSWFGFLFATLRSPLPDPPDRALALFSADRNRSLPPQWPVGLVVEERLQLPLDDMLTSADIRQRLCAYVDRADR